MEDGSLAYTLWDNLLEITHQVSGRAGFEYSQPHSKADVVTTELDTFIPQRT